MTAMAPYDEEIIVKLFEELYHLLITLCAIEEHQISFPPAGGHSINVELCTSLHIDAAVISLMRNIPYPKERETQLYFCLFPDGHPFIYVDDGDIFRGRDPDHAPADGTVPLRLNYVLLQDIAFTFPSTRDGLSVILDTKESKLSGYCSVLSLSSPYRQGPDLRLYEWAPCRQERTS